MMTGVVSSRAGGRDSGTELGWDQYSIPDQGEGSGTELGLRGSGTELGLVLYPKPAEQGEGAVELNWDQYSIPDQQSRGRGQWN